MTPPAATAPVKLRPAKTNVYRNKAPAEVPIHRSTLCTAHKKAAGVVRHIEFDMSGTDFAGACQPGQALGVLPAGEDKNGKPHKMRLYSISSPTRGEDGAGNIIGVTVKRTIDEHWEDHTLFLGVASNFLCDRQEGASVQLCGPSGKRFVLPEDADNWNYLFVATGTGIAPFRGMIMDLMDAGVSTDVTLLMGVPYATDLLYHAEMLALEEDHPNFHYITAVSRERQADGHDQLYVQDRLRTHRDMLLPQLASGRNLIYICGLAGMELGIFQQLAYMLQGDDLAQYLHADGEALRDIRHWDRRMIGKEIKLTDRVFMEVYA